MGDLDLSLDTKHPHNGNINSDDANSTRSGGTTKEQLQQHLNIDLPPEESHLFLVDVIGLKDSCSSKLKHVLFSIFFNIFYLFYWAWFPHKYYLSRFNILDTETLDEADYVLVTDKLKRQSLCKIEPTRPLAQYEIDMGITDSLDYTQSDFQYDKMFMYRNRRFIYNASTDMFELLHCPKYYSGQLLDQRKLGQGLTQQDLVDNATLYGRNVLKIAAPSWGALFVEEFLKPFFCFQVYSVIVWLCEQYFMFAPVIGVMAIASVVISVWDTKSNFKRLQALASHENHINVIRNGEKQLVNADQLVIGDLILLTEGRVPCDAVILSGSAVLSEASLTGESLPIRKSNLDFSLTSKRVNVITDKSMIYGGTTILQLKPEVKDDKNNVLFSQSQTDLKNNDNVHNNPLEGEVLAMVTKVGYYTTNGNLVSSILFPAETNFEFTRQTYKYLGVLLCLALIGFVWTLWRYSLEGAAKSLMALRSLDLLTIVVPPSLPLAMSTAISFALSNLKKHKIFCINGSVIPIAGKVKICGFDKTGTLTTDTLLVRGVFSHLSSLSHAIHTYQVRMHSDEYHQGVAPSQVDYHPTPTSSTPLVESHAPLIQSGSSSSLMEPQDSIFEQGMAIGDDDDDEDILDIPEPTLVHPEIVHSHCLPLVIRDAISVCHALAYDDTGNDPVVKQARDDLYIDMSFPYPTNDNKLVLAAYEQRELRRKQFVANVVGDPLEIAAFDSVNATFTENSYPHSLFSVELLPYKPVDQQFCRHSHTHVPLHDHDVDSIIPPCTCYHSLENTQVHNRGKTSPNNGNNNDTWIVLRQFAFDAALQRMAVIALHIPTKKLHVFIKGAPEVLFDMSINAYDDSSKYIDRYIVNNTQQLHTKPLPKEDCTFTKMCIDKISPHSQSSGNFLAQNLTQRFANTTTTTTAATITTSPRPIANHRHNHSGPHNINDKSFTLTSSKDLQHYATLTTQYEREQFVLMNEHRKKVEEYSRCGYRVLGLATREITITDLFNTTRTIPNQTATNDLQRLVDVNRDVQEMTINEILETVATIFNQFDTPDIRRTCENNLSFLGLLVLENQLKPATIPTIHQLMSSGLRTVMITGDNIRTACAVSKECGIVTPGTSLFVSEIRIKSKFKNLSPNDLKEITPQTHEVVWRNSDNPRITLDPITFQVIAPEKVQVEFDRYELAVSGPALTLLVRTHNESIQPQQLATFGTNPNVPQSSPALLSPNPSGYYDDGGDALSATPTTPGYGNQIPVTPYARSTAYTSDANSQTGTTKSKKRQTGMKDSTAAASTSIGFGQLEEMSQVTPIQKILLSSCVLARFTPDQKALAMTEYNKLGLYSSFVGDGANDSGALKAASISISLADTEASIAAPLTSQVTDISSLICLLTEGRGALTSAFLLFRYMAMYSFIQFFCVILLYFFSANLCDLQFLYQDLFAVFPIGLVMARVSAAKTLTLKRPSANLLAFSNLFGVFLHMLCSGILQWLLFAMTPWAILSPNYSRPPNPDHVCVIHEATALHYYTSLSYVYYAVVLSVGPNARKWKRSIFTNYLYIAICAISTLCSVLGLLFGPSRLWFLFTSSTDQKIDDQLKLAVLLWTIFGTITCLIVENILIPAIRYCSKLRLQKYRTYTVFGAGNSQFGKKRLNAKPYHAIRAEFEANFGRNNVKRVKTSRSSLSKAV